MFEKTNLIFKFTYFLGSITPAIILFSISLGVSIKIVICELIIGIVSTLILRRILNGISKSDSGTTKLIHEAILEEKNGDVLALIFGIIIPSVIIPDNLSVIGKISFFLIIQCVIYFLMVRSSSIFPNVLLILFGVNTYRLTDGTYLIDPNKSVNHKKVSLWAKRIGSSSINNTYVIVRRKNE